MTRNGVAKTLRIEFAAVALSTLASLSAAARPAGDAFEACAKRTHGATFPLLHCYSVEIAAVERLMNVALAARAETTVDPKAKGYFERSQAAWSDFRDAWCEANVARRGSLARLKLMACRLSLAKQRLRQLTAEAY